MKIEFDIFSQPDVNITWITGHIHRSIVDKIDSTSEYVEMVKKIYIINYIGLHSFYKRRRDA
jgi:phage-related holin